ncbi:MAG: phosphopentomutase, partial [Oscillospiraceae bacterium]
YNACEIARSMLTGSLAVGRVIARPFVGDEVNGYTRTARRHDFSILPPDKTLLDFLCKNGKKTIGVGKIYDIFAGQGIDETFKTANNSDGMQKTMEIAKTDFEGLCFVNLVDFDMVYGHRNDVDGYATAATAFDVQLAQLLPLLKNDDILMITADHGCDPATPSTDHSRECVPLVVYGDKIKRGVNLGTLTSYADIAATLADYFDINAEIKGKSFFDKIKNN